ncbi:MAG: (2Fe-2S) ferredoxin domain-containing protein [Kofleriaceae bacterium]
MSARRFKVLVCRGPECGDRRGSATLQAGFATALAARGLTAAVELGWQSCFGRCTLGPNVLVREVIGEEPARGFATLPGPRGKAALYSGVDVETVARIVDEHVAQGRAVRELLERAAAHQAPLGAVSSRPSAAAPPVDPARRPEVATHDSSHEPMGPPGRPGDRQS